jgi:hypothetical protein
MDARHKQRFTILALPGASSDAIALDPPVIRCDNTKRLAQATAKSLFQQI